MTRLRRRGVPSSLELKVERIKHWLSVGAQPSETLTDVLVKNNIMDGAARKAEIAARIEAKKKSGGEDRREPAECEEGRREGVSRRHWALGIGHW